MKKVFPEHRIMNGGHEVEIDDRVYLCTGRVWEVRNGTFQLYSVYLIPVSVKYMVGANIAFYSDMFEHNAEDLVWRERNAFAR